ncbi:MAG: hypothetical protein QOI29_1894 [Mycobacterium sp.]|nr:hypothetical protein [Mycobacterium sp.]
MSESGSHGALRVPRLLTGLDNRPTFYFDSWDMGGGTGGDSSYGGGGSSGLASGSSADHDRGDDANVVSHR